MRIAAWVVLAVTATGAGSAPAATLEQLLSHYDSLQVSEIVWGQESDDAGRVGVMDPPHFKATPGRVEVIEFLRYTNFTWQRSQPFTDAWRASLPAGVVVHRMPRGVGGDRRHPYRDHWEMHQRLFFAAQVLGFEDRVHEKMVTLIGQVGTAVGTREQVVGLAGAVGISPTVLMRWMDSPLVDARVRMASSAAAERSLADNAAGARRDRSSLSPALVINGRYVVSAAVIGDPGQAYRVANRIIRQELEAGRAQAGPTNDEEFTQWMAPREGEMFGRQRFGKTLKFRGVYSHGRRELWELDDAGEVRRAYRLKGEGDRSYFEASDGGDTVQYAHVWRHARQYVAFEGSGGPQRYGAFLLTDYLCDRNTLWVGLPFRGHEAALAFTSDGRVEARKGEEAVFGSWWLEAGTLHVSLGDFGIESWPWKEAAAHVGFEVPESAVTPWKKRTKGRVKIAGDGK